MKWTRIISAAVIATSLLATAQVSRAASTQLLNVSYDPTRELYQDFNQAFAKYWKAKTGQDVTIKQSHGGSSKQTRAVIDGLAADVVTLGLPSDIDQIAKAGLIQPGWEKKLPNNSTPYTSTVVFVVRKGNPKGIHDWSDLIKPGVQVITPNPKTSAGGHMAYYAAYAFEAARTHSDTKAIRDFLGKLYTNVPVLDSGARGSTTTFVQRGIGDVLIAWENEALLTVNQLGKGEYQVIYPSISVLAEPSVAVVDKVAGQHGTSAVAAAYLQYLYSPEGQAIAARHYYRPRNAAVAKKYASQFPKIKLLTIKQVFGGWGPAQQWQLNDGGVFDQVVKH